VSKLGKVFDDAYKSELSVVVVDNIERLLDYVRIGPRFSNNILQTLFLLLKRMPPPGRRLLIVGTTSNKSFLEDVGLVDAFNAVFNVPNIREGDEITAVLKELGCFTDADLKLVSRSIHRHIPIKKLLMIAEMARLGDPAHIAERFVKALQDFGVE
jgi:vesicle-fusing ATPase